MQTGVTQDKLMCLKQLRSQRLRTVLYLSDFCPPCMGYAAVSLDLDTLTMQGMQQITRREGDMSG